MIRFTRWRDRFLVLLDSLGGAREQFFFKWMLLLK